MSGRETQRDVAVAELHETEVADLLPLWAQYQRFYRTPTASGDERRNREHIARIATSPELGKIFVARECGEPIGFATLYYSFTSTRSARLAVINDLFVVERMRGRGHGRRLLDTCIAHARSAGIDWVEWLTERENRGAQRLYDSYAKPSEWLAYTLRVSPLEREH